MKKVIPLLLLTASAVLPAWAQPIAHERYLVGADGVGYLSDVHMALMVESPAGTSQFLPPDSTGIIAYYGLFNGADVDANSDTRWEIGNPRLVYYVTRGSLVYNNLSALGGKLEVATGGLVNYARLDTSDEGAFKDYVVPVTPGANNPEGGNLIGKDGTTLYFSFLYKLDLTLDSGNQNTLSLSDTVNLTRGGTTITRSPTTRWNFGQTWGNADFRADPGFNFGPYDTDTHFVVVKVQYQAGNDSVTVWFDPDLTKTEAEQQTNLPGLRDMRFSALRMVGQRAAPGEGHKLDEIRFGANWESVVQLAEQYDFVVTQPATGGTVTQSPEGTLFLEGTEVQLTALPAEGFRFVQWTGDVEEADKDTLIITVVTDKDRAISAEFEAIPEYTVTVNVTPAESGTVEAFPGLTAKEGEEVELTAIAADGFEFTGWTRGGATLTENPLVITLEADETITANFEEIVVVVPCTVTDVVFDSEYYEVLAEDFVYGISTPDILYTGYCPFVYSFETGAWWYVDESSTSPDGFFIYDFGASAWKYVLAGFILDL